MIPLFRKPIADTFRCALRIRESATHEWLLSIIRETTANFNSDSSNPQLVIYDAGYRHCIAQDLGNGLINKARILLCLEEECADSYLDLLHLNVRHIIYPQSPFSGEALQLAIRSVGTPTEPQATETEGLDNAPSANAKNGNFPQPGVFLTPHSSEASIPQLHLKATIKTPADYEAVPAELIGILDKLEYGHHISNAALVLREALTNAVFHAFRKPGSHTRKYTPESFQGFQDNDQVELVLVTCDTWARITVSDNSGSLGPLSVANSMDRHKSDRGVLDTRGRGFYLMHHLSHRMVVTICRGVSTTLDLYFLKECPAHYCRHFELIEG